MPYDVNPKNSIAKHVKKKKIIFWCTDSKLARELRWVAFQAILQAIISIWNKCKKKIPADINLNYLAIYWICK